MPVRDVLPKFRIAVVGAGAIGSFYGAKLAYHGSHVHFLMRSDLATVRKHGIHIRSKAGNFCVAKVNCYGSTMEIGPCDLVLIAIKATSNADLLELIPPLLHERTILLTLQNGFGNDEFLAQNFGAKRVVGGLCFVCLSRAEPGVIEHFDYGKIALGEYRGRSLPRTHDITREFKRCGITCKVVENLALERWRKLVWNIPFNGLSVTAGGVDTAEILADDNLRAETLALMDEVIAGANKCGHFLSSAEALAQMKRTEEMGKYKPSTLVDFESGKSLEVEAIWGEPLRRAMAAGAKMPRLESLYFHLKELNRHNRMGLSPVAHDLPNEWNNSRAIEIHNRQRAVKIDLGKLQSFAMRALALCTKARPARKIASQKLPAIQVILISDRRMSELHRRFLQRRGPTDVITFQHGEIFIDVETARRQARTLHTTLMKELQLYLVHGLLHLRGFDDKIAAGSRAMKLTQERILLAASK